MKPIVLVTGAGGFLGNHLVRELLSRGYTVRALVRPPRGESSLAGLGVTLYLGDITQSDVVERAVEGCAYVIHGAALTSVNPACSSEHWRVNLTGTETVSRAARQGAYSGSFMLVQPTFSGLARCTSPARRSSPTWVTVTDWITWTANEPRPFAFWLKYKPDYRRCWCTPPL